MTDSHATGSRAAKSRNCGACTDNPRAACTCTAVAAGGRFHLIDGKFVLTTPYDSAEYQREDLFDA
jgi:hypothetical protein